MENEKKAGGKKHPILWMWLKLLAVMIGSFCFLFFVISGLFIFVIAPFMPVIAICFVAIGFGLSARKSQERRSKTICLGLCITMGVLGIVGFPLWSKIYAHRPEPSIQEAKRLFQSHQATLKAAADTIHPGDFISTYRQSERSESPEVHAALEIYGVTQIQSNDEGAYVRFTLHFRNYFGHKGDYRYLFYVPTDEIDLITPLNYKEMHLVEKSGNARHYLIQIDNVMEGHSWYNEWYAERIAAGWFYAASVSKTAYPAQGKERFGAM